MELKDLLATVDVEETQGPLDKPVDGLSYDSRKVKRGYVFFAVRGLCSDGHDFVAQAVERGSVALSSCVCFCLIVCLPQCCGVCGVHYVV